MTKISELSKDQQEYFIFLVKESFGALSNAEDNFEVNHFASCTASLFHSAELFWKALTILSNRYFEPKHEATQSDIRQISNDLISKNEKLKIITILNSFPDLRRDLARYGYYEKGKTTRSPLKQFGLTTCKKDLNNVIWLANKLREIQYCKIFETPPLRTAVLSGYVNGKKEKRCTFYPWSKYRKVDGWIKDLNAITNENGLKIFERLAIPIANLNCGIFPLCINPFGEAIPEKGKSEGKAFRIICRYVRDGGIFINSGGHPFIYGWDVDRGKNQPLISFILALHQLEFGSVASRSALKVQQSMNVPPDALLLKRIFGLEAIWDRPDRGVSGEKEVKIEFAKSLARGISKAKAKVYRPVKSGSPNTIPFMKSSTSFWGNIYPVCAVKFGRGFLVHTGFSLNERREYELLLDIITRLSTRAYKTLARARLIRR